MSLLPGDFCARYSDFPRSAVTPSDIAQDGNQPLAYSAVTRLSVTGGSTFAVSASSSAKYSISGGKPSKGTLDYDADGRTVSGSLSAPKGVIDSPGVKSVVFNRMAAVNIL